MLQTNVSTKEMFSVPYFALLDGYYWVSGTYFGSLPLVLVHFESNRSTLLKHYLEVSYQKSTDDFSWKSIIEFPSIDYITPSPKYKIN